MYWTSILRKKIVVIRLGTEQDPLIGNNEGDGIFTIPNARYVAVFTGSHDSS
jgi:hypothetical protein